MLRTEFEKLTGFYPTEIHYSAIEEAYMLQSAGKEEFCQRYKENADGIAEEIQREVNLTFADEAKAVEKRSREQAARIKRLEAEIRQLKSRIWKMEGWEPYQVSKIAEYEYKVLKESVDFRDFVENPYKFGDSPDVYAWICDNFGFDKKLIQIIEKIPLYERSKDGRIRKTGEHEERQPEYYSTDWNYVRFDAGPYQYEVVDGELYMYKD